MFCVPFWLMVLCFANRNRDTCVLCVRERGEGLVSSFSEDWRKSSRNWKLPNWQLKSLKTFTKNFTSHCSLIIFSVIVYIKSFEASFVDILLFIANFILYLSSRTSTSLNLTIFRKPAVNIRRERKNSLQNNDEQLCQYSECIVLC